MCWIPSHICTTKNESADKAAEHALDLTIPEICIHHEDYIPGHLSGQEEIVSSHINIGNSCLTHSYLKNTKDVPRCLTCDCDLSVVHSACVETLHKLDKVI